MKVTTSPAWQRQKLTILERAHRDISGLTTPVSRLFVAAAVVYLPFFIHLSINPEASVSIVLLAAIGGVSVALLLPAFALATAIEVYWHRRIAQASGRVPSHTAQTQEPRHL